MVGGLVDGFHRLGPLYFSKFLLECGESQGALGAFLLQSSDGLLNTLLAQGVFGHGDYYVPQLW